ncbi:MAG TPA: hypothetical protein VFI82_07735 [Terriglobales bacterium]|jgi:hypothetical protein|nr:hypothetical protein [Terriglobales bacterium]
MIARRSTALIFLALVLAALACWADKTKPATTPRMSQETRMQVIRGLNAEMVFARRPFPVGPKGLTLKNGKVSPSEEEVERMVATYGPSVKPGDRARITGITFKGDNAILFEINGGPIKKKKWYEHIEIGSVGGSTTPTNPTDDKDRNNVRGTVILLAFDKYVPEMSIDEVKMLLRPLLDFNAKSAAEAYMDTLPPKLKEAIKNHQVLVGMNREMVTYAVGRPPKKYRDHDGATEYEEWIYGEPPKDVQFVRFVGDEVVRLEIMKVGGEKVVRTDREIDMKSTVAQRQVDPVELSNKPGKAPTLRRPGEQPAEERLPKGGVDDPEPRGGPPAIPGNGPPES